MEIFESFQKLIEQDEIYLTNLLFGNGFSINFGARFVYSNLFEEAKQFFEEQDEEMFKNLDTTNFEAVLRVLHTAIETNKIFEIEHSSIQDSYERIKLALIETVKNVHPQSYEISPSDVNDLRTTFRLFRKKVFTTNYGLLAYWALNKVRNEDRKVSDGFGFDADTRTIMYSAGPGISEDENPVRLYHLHGSLHLYMNHDEIIKITTKFNPVGTIENSLLETITDTYDMGYFPLYISEGTWKQKRNKILNNKYLRFCYSALQNISDGLTIYGQSLDIENDKHIIDAIKKSGVSKVAYGIFDMDNKNKIIREMVGVFEDSSVDLKFFDSRNFFDSLQSIEMDRIFG